MTERSYNYINNLTGWVTFAIAAVTYLLTLEPSASFWDCPEYIAQSYALEVGHAPGNPFFPSALIILCACAYTEQMKVVRCCVAAGRFKGN